MPGLHGYSVARWRVARVVREPEARRRRPGGRRAAKPDSPRQPARYSASTRFTRKPLGAPVGSGFVTVRPSVNAPATVLAVSVTLNIDAPLPRFNSPPAGSICSRRVHRYHHPRQFDSGLLNNWMAPTRRHASRRVREPEREYSRPERLPPPRRRAPSWSPLRHVHHPFLSSRTARSRQGPPPGSRLSRSPLSGVRAVGRRLAKFNNVTPLEAPVLTSSCMLICSIGSTARPAIRSTRAPCRSRRTGSRACRRSRRRSGKPVGVGVSDIPLAQDLIYVGSRCRKSHPPSAAAVGHAVLSRPVPVGYDRDLGELVVAPADLVARAADSASCALSVRGAPIEAASSLARARRALGLRARPAPEPR